MKKKKNGFTLVELLAVIVILAIIMVIAIPAVLNTMATARKQSFIIYFEKVVKDTQTQYMYDSNGGMISGAGIYVYNIQTDLGYPSTGGYKGYVTVDASNVDKVQYIVTLYDDNYEIISHNVTEHRMPTVDSGLVLPYKESEVPLNELRACWSATFDGAECFNKDGFRLTE